MQIVISGIPIEVQKKAIKNLHLSVKPPYGKVVISAPISMNDKAIEMFARTKLSWIKKQIKEYEEQPRSSKRQYVSGECIYIWGKQYFLTFVENRSKNSFELQGNKIILSMRAESTVKQRESYVREQYRAILEKEINRLLPKWQDITGFYSESWQTKYMVTKWGTCNTEKKKLWFNVQLAQKPIECLEYIILHELVHLKERTHNSVFCAYMDLYMPSWREIRKTLNDFKLDHYEQYDRSSLHKLIDDKRFAVIKKNAELFLLENGLIKDSSVDVDIEIENVININQKCGEVIIFDIIASCSIENESLAGKSSFTEKWVQLHCDFSINNDEFDFNVLCVKNIESMEKAMDDNLSNELVPIIQKENFDNEAKQFLEKYYPLALEKPVAVPIRVIAEELMNLRIIENINLSEELSIFGLIVFEDGNIFGKNRKAIIKDAKRGNMYIDPRVYYERTLGTVNSTIAHECFHWHRHQPYHALMKMIGSDDKLGKNIRCLIDTNAKDTSKWKTSDWLEWQANGIAMCILMPYCTAKIKINDLLSKYNISLDNNSNLDKLSIVIDELSEFYGVSRQAAKTRMQDLGFSIVDGTYAYINGQYIPNFTFNNKVINKNQTFTISFADLSKAYSLNSTFRRIIDFGNFIYVDGHVCINSSKYVYKDDLGRSHMNEYALSNIDKCCLVFDMGYTYQSTYQNQKSYSFVTKAIAQTTSREYSFEMNEHNKTLIEQIESASRRASAIRRYPGSFSETLVQLMKEKKLSNKNLADLSLVGEKTIQRLRNDEEYPTSIQSVLGLCVGLQLSLPEAEMLLEKTDFKLNSMKSEGYIYKCILSACAVNSIYEINEMLENNGIKPLGSDSYK